MRLPVLTALVCVGGVWSGSWAQVCDISVIGEAAYGVGSAKASVSGDVLCLAATYERLLLVYDVSDPTDPRLMSSVPSNGYTWYVEIRGTLAYVGQGGDLKVFDLSDPADPIEVHVEPGVGGSELRISASGTFACTRSSAGRLRIFDLADPSHPAYVSNVFISSNYGVALSGQYAYVSYRSGMTSNIRILDLTDLSAPVVVENARVQRRGTLDIEGELLALRADGYLQLYDLSDPLDPELLGSIDHMHQSGSVTLSGSVAYITSPGAGVRAIDISDPTNPVEVGTTSAFELAGRVAVDGAVAYTGADGRVWSLDLSIPMACVRADFADPAGALDYSDVLGFVAAFAAEEAAADLAEPAGVFDLADVSAFLGAFDECDTCNPYAVVPEGGRYLYRPEGVGGYAPVTAALAAVGLPLIVVRRDRRGA